MNPDIVRRAFLHFSFHDPQASNFSDLSHVASQYWSLEIKQSGIGIRVQMGTLLNYLFCLLAEQ